MGVLAEALNENPSISLSSLWAFAEMLAEVQSYSSKIAKQEAVGRWLHDDRHGEAIGAFLRYALSPYITFGIKTLDEEVGGDRETIIPPPSERVTQGFKLLDALARREITGNEMRSRVSSFLVTLSHVYPSPVSEREAFTRVLLKDLRAGFSEVTVNKAAPATVPVFSCQLAASEMPDPAELTYPIRVEPKYDGVRTIAIKKSGAVTLLSRNGKPFTNFEQLEKVLEQFMPDNIVLDGEVVAMRQKGEDAGQAFARLMKRARAETGKNLTAAPGIEFNVFDGMSIGEWEAQDCEAQLSERLAWLERIFTYPEKPEYPGQALWGKTNITVSPALTSIVRLTPGVVAADEEALRAFYDQCVEQRLEGVIIKDLAGPYTFKRNKTWRKLKPMETLDLTVVGAVEGLGKYAGSLGTLKCEGEHLSQKVACEVGSGFDDALRSALWADYCHDRFSSSGIWKLHGKIVEVKYQDISKSETSDALSLRFPVFVRFREQDAGGKI